jgi:hypothetical protein
VMLIRLMTLERKGIVESAKKAFFLLAFSYFAKGRFHPIYI